MFVRDHSRATPGGDVTQAFDGLGVHRWRSGVPKPLGSNRAHPPLKRGLRLGGVRSLGLWFSWAKYWQVGERLSGRRELRVLRVPKRMQILFELLWNRPLVADGCEERRQIRPGLGQSLRSATADTEDQDPSPGL